MGLASVVQFRPYLTNVVGLIDGLMPPSRSSCRSIVLVQVSTPCHLSGLTSRLDFAVVANTTALKLLDADLAVPLGVAKMLGQVCSSAALQGVLFREQLAKRGLTVADVFDGYAAMIRFVTPAAIAPAITRDPIDDQVPTAALAAQADLIVSGDAHLLDLKGFQGIEIVTAAIAVERIASAS